MAIRVKIVILLRYGPAQTRPDFQVADGQYVRSTLTIKNCGDGLQIGCNQPISSLHPKRKLSPQSHLP
jgi:hypothetical protein